MRTSRVSLGVYSVVLLLGLTPSILFGAWEDKTAGLPWVEDYPAKESGADGYKWIILQDKLGRLFVGGDQLQVFDGRSWQSYPVPNTYALRALAFGNDGKLWAGAVNEIGYFEEKALGAFEYRSLIQQLPEDERSLNNVWACAVVGRLVYFICADKILSWDGAAFKVRHYIGKNRLSALQLGGETWFHHIETGLYRLTEAGPQLEVAAELLPENGISGLARDKDGLLLVCNIGFFRPGNPPRQIFSPDTNRYIANSRLSCFSVLPDGNYAAGTVNGGLAIVSPAGELLRTLDTADGLPTRTIFSIAADRDGIAWCTTPTGIFRFEISGRVTLFNALNGLKGANVRFFQSLPTGNFSGTFEGTFVQEPITNQSARFRQLPAWTESYNHLLFFRGRMLLSRQGGVDVSDGTRVDPLVSIPAKTIYFTQPSNQSPGTLLASESFGVSKLQAQPDGTFTHDRFLELPDNFVSLYDDPVTGKLYIGTARKGAFTYDPRSKQLAPLNNPATGEAWSGPVIIRTSDHEIFFFLTQGLFKTDLRGANLGVVSTMPALTPIEVRRVSRSQDMLVAFKRSSNDVETQGLGVLSTDANGKTAWRELSVPALVTIGSLRQLEFSEENGRSILWVGGTEGVLRLDYDAIPAAQPPGVPLIRQDTLHSGQLPGADALAYPFKNHHLKFRVFTGDYARGRDRLFQSRLGEGDAEWSAPASRRSFDFTNLSEGDYRFEVRAVNPAGQASPPAVFSFRILPPWYRSGGAIAGYAAIIGLAVFGLIRVRERRTRIRNQELEALVEVRTAELVKASAAKDEFLAGISHEIRNPMNGVIGIAENFKTDGLDGESRRKFGLLRQCASHLSSLLEDILDFSKVQAGAIELDPKPLDLHELVDSVTAITRPDSEKYGIPVEAAVSPAVPRDLIGDARRIRQILINFVSNALKFSGRGQVSVTVWCKHLGATQTEVIFAVSDEGPGISAEEQGRLFTRFERGAAAQKGRVPGTGLGLALCKGLAEKMGGKIWLESEVGHGSCFYFSAPFALAAPAAEAAPVAIAAPAAPARTALVVDDQEYNRIVLADLLQGMGFTVQAAQEGSAALTLAGRQAFDVIFLDFNLPGLSGVDVARGIRTLPNQSAHALILATTAFTTPEKRAQCLDAGMDAFLGKPVTKERLQKALANLGAGASAAPAPAPIAPRFKPPVATSGPADRLGNLRLLARKKNVPFAEELALYLSELETELGQLGTALEKADAATAGHYAHLLCGRCGFIYERDLEQTQRRIEAAVGQGHWAEARTLAREFAAQLAELRIRLASSGPAVPPA